MRRFRKTQFNKMWVIYICVSLLAIQIKYKRREWGFNSNSNCCIAVVRLCRSGKRRQIKNKWGSGNLPREGTRVWAQGNLSKSRTRMNRMPAYEGSREIIRSYSLISFIVICNKKVLKIQVWLTALSCEGWFILF